MKRYNENNLPKHIVRHSPTGMAWGYGGSGPADLALSLLTEVIGEKEADKYYQDFKQECVSLFGGRWTITDEEITEWYKEKVNLYEI